MISLTKNQLKCLKEIRRTNGYPAHWMPKSRQKLVELGLVKDSNNGTRFSFPSFVLTDDGRRYLKAIGEFI